MCTGSLQSIDLFKPITKSRLNFGNIGRFPECRNNFFNIVAKFRNGNIEMFQLLKETLLIASTIQQWTTTGADETISQWSVVKVRFLIGG